MGKFSIGRPHEKLIKSCINYILTLIYFGRYKFKLMVEGDEKGKDYEFKSSVKYLFTTMIWHAKFRFFNYSQSWNRTVLAYLSVICPNINKQKEILAQQLPILKTLLRKLNLTNYLKSNGFHLKGDKGIITAAYCTWSGVSQIIPPTLTDLLGLLNLQAQYP